MESLSKEVVGRLPIDRGRGIVAAGDALVVVGLLLAGVASHGGDPLAEPAAALETVVPFAAGWAVVSVVAGAYERSAVRSVGESLRVAAVAWLAAANVGLILRSSPAFDGGASWPFTLIVTGLGLVGLLLWRGAYAAVVAD